MLTRLCLLALAALALTACDPIEPTSIGRVALDPAVSTTSGALTLEMRMWADTAGLGVVAPSSVPATVGYGYASSEPLTGLTFPHDYVLGGSIGTSPYKHWLVVAWLANSAGEPVPSSGEWFGERTVSFTHCMHTADYCGERTGQDLTIDQPVP